MALMGAEEFLKKLETEKPSDHIYGTCGICHKPITGEDKTPGDPVRQLGDGELVHDDCYWDAFGDELENYPIGRHGIRRGGAS